MKGNFQLVSVSSGLLACFIHLFWNDVIVSIFVRVYYLLLKSKIFQSIHRTDKNMKCVCMFVSLFFFSASFANKIAHKTKKNIRKKFRRQITEIFPCSIVCVHFKRYNIFNSFFFCFLWFSWFRSILNLKMVRFINETKKKKKSKNHWKLK